jgi:hypothetical protein
MDHLAVSKLSLRESLASLTTVSTSGTTLPTRPSTAGSFSSRRSSMTSFNSMSSYDNFEVVPKLIRTPWEADRSKRSYSSTRKRPSTAASLPARIFRDLPVEIYDCILAQLEQSYFCESVGTCTACYMKDLSSLALTSRTWERSAQRKLYVLDAPCYGALILIAYPSDTRRYSSLLWSQQVPKKHGPYLTIG